MSNKNNYETACLEENTFEYLIQATETCDTSPKKKSVVNEINITRFPNKNSVRDFRFAIYFRNASEK